MIELIAYGYLTLAFFCLAVFIWETWDDFVYGGESVSKLILTYTCFALLWPVAAITYAIISWDFYKAEKEDEATF